MLPSFAIIGAQKCSTSFVQECISDHPEIFLPAEEVLFFESPDYEQSSLDDLHKLFEGRREKILGIKRPTYLGKPEVPARISRDLPDAKLIAVLRNPVQRAVSAYFHYVTYGFMPPMEPEQGFRALLAGTGLPEGYLRSREIIEFGFYGKYLRQYENYIASGQMLVLLHDDILENPLSEIQRIYRYLGVSDRFVPETLNSRPQKVVYDMKRVRFLACRNRFMFEYNSDRTSAYRRKGSLASRVVSGSITGIDRFFLSKILKEEKPQLSVYLKRALCDEYAGDVQFVEGLLNRDLSTWKTV